jgi:hypothetical protein
MHSDVYWVAISQNIHNISQFKVVLLSAVPPVAAEASGQMTTLCFIFQRRRRRNHRKIAHWDYASSA